MCVVGKAIATQGRNWKQNTPLAPEKQGFGSKTCIQENVQQRDLF